MQIAVENLGCRRSGRRVFAGVSFRLGSGEAVVVTGRNGAGKSSLLAMLGGRLAPEAGTIRVEGAGERTLAECLHLVGHRDGLKPALSAEENLAFARDLLGDPAATPRTALETVGLAHVAAFPVGYLSAGQRRRVALARLLVARRPLWLLDEPAAALDAAAQETMFALMQRHLAEGGLLVAATHQPLGLLDARELKLDAIPSPSRGGAGVGGENPERDPALSASTEREAGVAPARVEPSGMPPTPTPPREGEGRSEPGAR